jgi:amidase
MDIPNLSAIALSHAIHSKAVSCREVISSFLNQIQTHNGSSNALVSLADPQVVLALADERDAQLARGDHAVELLEEPYLGPNFGFLGRHLLCV